MKFVRDALESAHTQMARIKAQSGGSFCTNYFRQEMVGEQVFTAATDCTLLLLNSEHDFFRLYLFTNDVYDLKHALAESEYPGDVVSGYLTRKADENIALSFEGAGFNWIATYQRMTSYCLPKQRPSPAVEYAVASDVDQLFQDLFERFNKYTDHLPTRQRLDQYVHNRQVIVNRRDSRILGAVCFQVRGSWVNYNYVYSISGNSLDFLRLQQDFYGVVQERGFRAGFLWINEKNKPLAALHEARGWQYDTLRDFFYFRPCRRDEPPA
jgi:hypothetical protein